MSWAADAGFAEFCAQFDFGFSSAHHFRSRHQVAAMTAMGDMMAAIAKRLR